jgi:hypothetical protein
MKICALITVAFVQSAASAASHSLSPAVEALAKASAEIESGLAGETNAPVKAKAKAIQKNIEALWLEAISVHLEATEERVKNLGIFPMLDSTEYLYVIRTSEKGRELESRARVQDILGWLELQAAAAEAVRRAREGRNLLQLPQYWAGISNDQVKNAANRFSNQKESAYKDIQKQAETTIECVGYVSGQMEQTGLKVQSDADGKFQWSVEDLRRVYGISNLEGASSEQKKLILARTHSLLGLPTKKLLTCVSAELIDFVRNERIKLGGGRQ